MGSHDRQSRIAQLSPRAREHRERLEAQERRDVLRTADRQTDQAVRDLGVEQLRRLVQRICWNLSAHAEVHERDAKTPALPRARRSEDAAKAEAFVQARAVVDQALWAIVDADRGAPDAPSFLASRVVEGATQRLEERSRELCDAHHEAEAASMLGSAVELAAFYADAPTQQRGEALDRLQALQQELAER